MIVCVRNQNKYATHAAANAVMVKIALEGWKPMYSGHDLRNQDLRKNS